MSRSTADHCANFGDSLPHSRPVPPIRSCSLCFSRSSLPCLGRPMRAQSRPPRHLRARATSRRRKRAANPPRAPTHSTLSAGVRPCGRRRERGGAAVGVYVRFSQVWSAAAIIKRVSRQVWYVYGMFFCSVPQQGTRREHTQNSTSCGHFRFPHVSGVWVGVGVGHEHKATVHEAFLHGKPGYQPITNRSGPGNNRSCSRLHHIYKHYPCTSSCMQGAPTALTMH